MNRKKLESVGIVVAVTVLIIFVISMAFAISLELVDDKQEEICQEKCEELGYKTSTLNCEDCICGSKVIHMEQSETKKTGRLAFRFGLVVAIILSLFRLVLVISGKE